MKAASNELLMINVDLICVIVEGKLNPFGVCSIDEAMLGLQISCLAGFHRTTTLDLAIDNRAILLLSRCFNTRPSRLLFWCLSPAELLRSELRRLFQLMRAIVECGSTCAVIVLRGSQGELLGASFLALIQCLRLALFSSGGDRHTNYGIRRLFTCGIDALI